MATTMAAYDGYFKELYGELSNTVPEHAILAEKIKFSEAERIGDSYHFPVRLQRSHGWTFESGSNSSTAFTLNAVKTGVMKDASLSGSIFVMRESFGYKAVLSATSAGKQAFGNLFDEAVEDMFNTASAMREITMLYGAGTIGTFNEAGPASTTATLDLTAASSSLGMLSQLEGAYIDAYSAVGGTKRNSNAAIEITAVEWDAASGICTLALSGNSSDIDAIAVGDVAIPYGADSKWFSGIDAIATNTGSLFGISATTYPTWKANEYSSGSAGATMGKLTKATSLVAQRSGVGKLTALVSTPTWADLNNNVAALRRLTEHSGKVEIGTEKITYHGPTGPLEIMAHPFIKQGEAFILDFAQFKRVGASDLTFNLGIGEQNDKFLNELADKAGFEIRCLWDLALICRRPRSMCKVTSIVNSL